MARFAGHLSGSGYSVLVRLASVLTVLAVPLMTAFPASADWGHPVQLSNSVGTADFPEIEASGQNVHVVWQDTRDFPESDETNQQGILSSRGAVGTVSDPRVNAADDPPTPEIYYKRSADGGQTWGPDVRLTNHPAASNYPDIALSANTVHVVWQDRRAEEEGIFYKRSADGGLTWGPDVLVSGTEHPAESPRVAASGDNVYVVFLRWILGEVNVVVKHSSDGGLTWGPDSVLVDMGYNSYADLAAAGNNVYVVWSNWNSFTDDRIVHFRKSADRGQTWTPDALIIGDSLNRAETPTIGVSGQYLHILWRGSVSGDFYYRVYYERSTDGGQTWGQAVRLSALSAQGGAVDPAISVLGANVHACWLDFSNSGDASQLYYSRSSNNGETWGEGSLVTPDARPSDGFPSLAASGTNVHLVWGNVLSEDHDQIYYIKYTGRPSSGSVNTPLGPVKFSASSGSLTGLRAVEAGCSVPGYTFPYGMFSFSVTGLTVGETVNITITFPGPIPAGTVYFKCQNGSALDCSAFTTIVDEDTIRLRLTDGGNGDSDRAANGSISDPGGPGCPVKAAPTSHGASMPSVAQAPVALPRISVQGASLSASRVAPGTPVTVTARVANEGSVNATTRVTLYVNSQEDSAKGLTLASGTATPVTFTVNRNEPGVYSVYVNGVQAGSFTVDGMADPNLVLWISASALGLALLIGVIYFSRRRQVHR